MAYNTNEERLLVKGSEQITRDLKVNRDAYIGETLDTKNLIIEDDLNVKGESIFDDDVAIHGDLYVEGTTTTTSEAQVSSSGNYIVTRDNNSTPLTTGEYSGFAVNNYATGKIATITADKDGTWRISDSATASATTYTNISAYNGVYYTGLSQTTTTGPSGILTNVDADELASVVLNGSSYYHKAGNDWFGPVTLVSNALDMGSIVTDATLIATLNGLTKHDLVYYRSAVDKTIDASTNQPLLTRAEASNLTGGQALTWDATNEKAVGKTIDTTVTANSSNLITSGAVNTAISSAVDALDVASVGGDGKYISAISETDGKISATATTMDTAPTASSTKAVTSGGVYTAIDNEATARNNAISSAIATEVTNRNIAITNAINALDVSSVGGDGKYISAISETDGKISATVTTMDTTPTASSTKAVTSGGVKTAIDAEATARGTAITNAINALDVTDTAVSGKYVSAVSETNGKISVTREDLPSTSNAKSLNGSVNCETAAATAAKTVTLAGFSLNKGAKLIVNVVNANTSATALTLNVNSTGAKTIRVNGTTTSTSSYSLPAGYYNCYYDGTYWNMDNGCEAFSARTASNCSGNSSSADFTRSTAVCTTAAGTAAKTAAMRGYALSTGSTFPITFTNSNSAASELSLSVNGTTAKVIFINNAPSSSSNYTLPSGTYLCRFNGTGYYIDTAYAVTQARNSTYAEYADYTRGTAYCSTAAGTAAKTASMRGYVLQSGATFPITFANTNTASALTLNINSTGAKPIYINNAASTSNNHTLPAGTYICRYNGTNYYIDTQYFVTNARTANAATTATTATTANRIRTSAPTSPVAGDIWIE